MGNFTIVFDCLGFGNDFHLEFEVIRAMASAWHICAEHKVEVYDENVNIYFEYLLFNFVKRSMFPKQKD